MLNRVKSVPGLIVLLILISFQFVPTTSAGESNTKVRYKLAISFDLDNKQLHGTAHITLAAGEGLTLYLDDIETTGIVVQNNQSPPAIYELDAAPQMNISADNIQQEVYISYRKTVEMEADNFIERGGITLLSNWHPQPSRDVIFSLTARVPTGFVAISETDHFSSATNNTYSFSFSQPASSLNFIAAPFVVDSLEVRPDLKVYTFLYTQDRGLAKDYLKAASEYLLQYEKSIGPYPYNHFAIVENLRPTGYGMPTFTLLGSMVIRLPFIINTSLGHEILHSWFGNGVRVDETSGNWCEGLTSYLADWTYKERRGQGTVNRKENIIKYLSYVPDDNSITLQSFHSASHNQAMANAVRSVGYIKGAMLFHELKNRIGQNTFDRGISLFYKKHKGMKASWQDIQATFEEISQLSLDSFFSEKLNRKDIAELEIDDIRTDSFTGQTSLSLTITQKTTTPYHLLVPIMIETSNGPVIFHKEISSEKETIQLVLEATPLNISLDPNYDLLRKLDDDEAVPTWSQVMGATQKTVIIASQDRAKYAPLLRFFSKENSTVIDINEVKNSALEKTNLIFLGVDNRISRSLFAIPTHPPKGLTLDVRPHPLNSSKVVLLVSCSNGVELKKSLRLLPHYGKYSYLHFDNGRIKNKKISAGTMGQNYTIEQPVKAIASSTLVDFSDIITNLANARAIYIGESHTSMADHHLQLRLIEDLHHQNRELAIGMEMFPKSSQQALDDFILGNEATGEQLFLKQSKYFQVWKYDYRYYRKIITYARKHKIQIIGLNTDRNIVSSVFRTGSTDSLTEKELSLLPEDRNLDMPGYLARLSAVHGFHDQGKHGRGNLGGFIQAQGIWDEIMAQNVADYLKNNPQKRMIILAGSQHTRNDSGIPPRVQRRLAVNQYSILNGVSYTQPTNTIADYYIFTSYRDLPSAGKIGVTLEEKEKAGDTFLQIAKLSPHSKAQESGLQEKDTLLSINGYDVKTMEDIRIAMFDANPGDTVDIEIERTGNSLHTEQLKVTVELYEPAQARR